MFQKLENFIDDKKRLPNQSKDHKDKYGRTLERWVRSQRENFNLDKLTKERYQKLSSLNLWSWDVNQDKWEKQLKEIKDFITAKKELPKRTTPSLGHWLYNQKISHQNKTLKKLRYELLDEVVGDFEEWDWEK